MNAVRVSKRLITAIIGFVLSVVLCLGICLAWFAMNKHADSGGSSVSINNGEIVRFDVNVYYLNTASGGFIKASTGNVAVENGTVDHETQGKIDEGDNMRPYGGFGNNYATAVLFDIEYEIRVSDKSYRIFASCPKENGDLSVTPIDETKNSFTSDLSNVVGFYNAKETGAYYNKTTNSADTFLQSDFRKIFNVSLKNNIVPNTANGSNGNFEGRVLFIMDYMQAPFNLLSTLMASEGGRLDSRLVFNGDLTISIETYNSEGESAGPGSYSYKFGENNASWWHASSGATTGSDDNKALSINTSNYLLFTATGTKATVAVTGFTTGSNSASQYMDVQFLDDNEEVIGVLHAYTPANKATGDYTFDSNVFTSSKPFAYIKFIGTTSSKTCGILTVTLDIE